MVPAIFIWGIQQLTKPAAEREIITWNNMLLLLVPCLCDLLCTLLLLLAQLYITASLWQMMRGTVIIITAILKKVFLNHNLRKHMWAGVLVITLAMVVIASTTFFGNADPSAEATSKDPRIGVLLVLLGCLAQGVQYVFEEKVMAVDDISPLVITHIKCLKSLYCSCTCSPRSDLIRAVFPSLQVVIGFEVIWGALLSIVLIYPIAYIVPGKDNGSYENPFDSYAMIVNSPFLRVGGPSLRPFLKISFFTEYLHFCRTCFWVSSVSSLFITLWRSTLPDTSPPSGTPSSIISAR